MSLGARTTVNGTVKRLRSALVFRHAIRSSALPQGANVPAFVLALAELHRARGDGIGLAKQVS